MAHAAVGMTRDLVVSINGIVVLTSQLIHVESKLAQAHQFADVGGDRPYSEACM